MANQRKRPVNDPRIILRIEISQAAERRLSEATRRNGMTHLTTHGRVIEWFANQSPLVQGAILGKSSPEAYDQASETILKSMAGRK